MGFQNVRIETSPLGSLSSCRVNDMFTCFKPISDIFRRRQASQQEDGETLPLHQDSNRNSSNSVLRVDQSSWLEHHIQGQVSSFRPSNNLYEPGVDSNRCVGRVVDVFSRLLVKQDCVGKFNLQRRRMDGEWQLWREERSSETNDGDNRRAEISI